jgi:hypothetical protein
LNDSIKPLELEVVGLEATTLLTAGWPFISTAQTFTSLSITIAVEIPVTLAQQFLGAAIGGNLTAAIPTTTRDGY